MKYSVTVDRSDNIGWTPAKTYQNSAQDLSDEEHTHSHNTQQSQASENISSPLGRRIIEQKLRKKIYVEHFPGNAGATTDDDSLQDYGYTAYAHHDNI